MMQRTRLGEFLRHRRARLSPTAFDLPVRKRRRTPGLRREEVAQIAGISIAYYTWIEQGRDLNVSPDVLRAIAGALRLDAAERAYLTALAAQPAHELAAEHGAALHPSVRHLLEERAKTAAFVYDRWFDVVAANALGESVFACAPSGLPQSNLLRRMFFDPQQRERWSDWEGEARLLLGLLRQALVRWPDASEGRELEAELEKSAEFARLWADYDVASWPSPEAYFREEASTLAHPLVGALRIHRIATALGASGELTLLLASPADAETARKLDHLLGVAQRRSSGLMAIPA